MKLYHLLIFLLGTALLVRAEEDGNEQAEQEEQGDQAEQAEAEHEDAVVLEKHPGADVKILFTKPIGGDRLISGDDASVLVGFTNRAHDDLYLDTLDASFRYAVDFTYVLQNLSAIAYNRKLESGQEASMFYQFHVADAFAGRPIGLDISLVFHDAHGRYYRQAVFNGTLTVEEPEVIFDVETMFLYVFMVACFVIGLVLLYNCLASGKKITSKGSRPTETGTKGQDVDFEWLPNTVLKQQKTPSPRQRKTKNA